MQCYIEFFLNKRLSRGQKEEGEDSRKNGFVPKKQAIFNKLLHDAINDDDDQQQEPSGS